jgi:hypothetical protein
MKCENAVDFIVDSLMDSLDEEQRKDLSAHIQSCESCAAEAEKMSAIWKGLGELRVPKAAPQAAFEFGRRLSAEQSRRRYAPLLRAAASIALVLLGATGGFLARGSGSLPSAPPTGASTFLFLVRGEQPQGSVPGETLVQEYRDWASSLADEGRLAGANKLKDEPGSWVSGSTAGESRTRSDIQGYFVVRASSYSEALEIAGTSPHIRYGGTFEIRQIDPTN